MGVRIFGGPVTGLAAAKNLTTLLSLSPRVDFSTMTLRAKADNTGTVFIGRSDVTTTTNQVGYLRAAEALSVDIIRGFSNTDEVFLIGTVAGDTVYIMGME